MRWRGQKALFWKAIRVSSRFLPNEGILDNSWALVARAYLHLRGDVPKNMWMVRYRTLRLLERAFQPSPVYPFTQTTWLRLARTILRSLQK